MAKTKKAEAVEAVKETAAVVEEVKTETPVKKAPAKKAPAKKPAANKTAVKKTETVENVVIQQNGNEVTAAEIIAKAKADAGVDAPAKIDVYVRPEINMVYYVIDGEKFGNFELC